MSTIDNNSPRRLQISTPTDTTIVFNRTFGAPRRLVWEAMTQPERLRKWMYAPSGWNMTTCEFDARKGGTYRWAWADDSGTTIMTLHGTMTEVAAPTRVVHTQIMEMHQCSAVAEFVVALELTELGDRTAMRMTLTFPTKAARDNALTWGMEKGMEAGYARIDAMLAQVV